MKLWALAIALFAGCTARPSFVGGSGTTHGRGEGGQIAVADLFGLRHDEAIAALRAAGATGDITEDKSPCGSVVDGRVIEIGEVCYQHPPAGRVQPARLPISIRVQLEEPRYGNAGKATEWRLMPALAGMSEAAARAALKEAGFANEDRVRMTLVDEPGCRPSTVCRTYPEAMERAGVHSDQVLFIASDPNPATGSSSAEQAGTPQVE